MKAPIKNGAGRERPACLACRWLCLSLGQCYRRRMCLEHEHTVCWAEGTDGPGAARLNPCSRGPYRAPQPGANPHSRIPAASRGQKPKTRGGGVGFSSWL